ncbi:MAG: shikimate kinase [Deltaproteobacteria bacterium]|nr:shikimate kinase [Deltaproteobacteria bacterium]
MESLDFSEAMSNIVLIGYRASGKTTVGQQVAQSLKRVFVDLDQVLEQEAGETIAELVAREGWPEFRRREKALVARYAEQSGLVMATGGGVVTDAENIARLKKNGLIIWLDAEPKIIQARLAQDQAEVASRPALTGGQTIYEVEEVLATRQPLYQAAADVIISTSQLSIDQVADQIIEAVRQQETKTGGR